MTVVMDSTGMMSLQPELLTIKHSSEDTTLYPNHAYARGGVGHFLATSGARGSITRLPQAKGLMHSTASSRATSGRSASTSYSSEQYASTDPAAAAARDWERGSVQHPHNFVAACRSVRPWDVPNGSRWTAVSFFENDPREIKRHMEIIDWIQATHEQGKVLERQAEQVRHKTWAEQQRDTFRRQRLEQAARYTQAGMRPRSAYADLGATAAAEDVHASNDPAHRFWKSGSLASSIGGAGGSVGRQRPYTALGASGAGMRNTYAETLAHAAEMATARGVVNSPSAPLSARSANSTGGLGMQRPPSIPLPKKTYTKVYDRMAAEAAETPAAKAAAALAARARMQEERATVELQEEMQALDTFEAHVRSLQRARSKAMRDRRMDPSAVVDEYYDR